MTIDLKCAICRKTYKVKPYRKEISKCCSRSCLWHFTKKDREPQRLLTVTNKKAYNNASISIKCINCKNKIDISPSRLGKKKFCSRKCYAEKVHQKYGNNQKYKKITIEGKNMLLHRHIMENHLNRKLLKNEHVHHLNGNKQDNNIDNLKILSCSEHTKVHKMMIL